MTTPKQKIKVKPFVSDLRNGMGDRELMEKYTLSENQLHKVLHRLVDAGTIDEMELFLRSYLSDGFMTGTFADTQCAMEEMGYKGKIKPPPDLETPSNISITERVNTTSSVFRRMLAKLAGTGSQV